MFCFPSNLSVKHRLRFYSIRQVCVSNCGCPVCESAPGFCVSCPAVFGVYHHPQQTVGCSVCSLPLPWVHDSQPQPDSACLSKRFKTKPKKERKKKKKNKERGKKRTFVRQHKCFHVQTCGVIVCASGSREEFGHDGSGGGSLGLALHSSSLAAAARSA